METTVITVVLIAFLSLIIIVVNQQEKTKSLEALVNVLLLLLVGGMALIGGLTLLSAFNPRPNSPVVDVKLATIFFAASLVTALICTAIVLSRSLRVFIQRFIIRSDQHNRYFEADSYVHMTALVFMVMGVFNTVGNFALAGGVEGMAESMQETGMGVPDLLVNMLLYLSMALLGVGFLQRRNIQETWKRLGLSFSPWHLIVGFFVGFGLFWVQVGMGIVWQSLVSPEMLSEQTAAAQEIFSAFSNSLWLGFLLALTAGVGEEILFRGALQPIFGNILVSLFFVMLHSQYILTPASLIILVVSLVFGLLRQHYSTSSAIVAHIVYNFTPFVMVFLASQMGVSI